MRAPASAARCLALVAALSAAPSARLIAQAPPAPPPSPVAASYMERYREVTNLAPLPTQVADVHHLVLRRDAGQLILETGKLYLLSPVGGRTVGAVFEGSGRFVLTPPIAVEQAELKRFAGDTTLDDSLHEVILIFADSTGDQLHGLTFGPGDVPGEVGNHVGSLINTFKGDKEGSFDGAVMGPLLNGETSGFFLARVARNHGDAVLFELDPAMSEAVQLFKPVPRARWGTSWAVVTRFAAARRPASASAEWYYRNRLRIPRYKLDVQVTEEFNGNLSLAAAATLTLVGQEPVGPWLHFDLHYRLTADSARWGNGEAAPLFKADQDGTLWVRVGRRLAPNDTLMLMVYYHGDIFYRALAGFRIEPGAAWFPHNEQGPMVATFDLTYHSPSQYPLVSIGERVDSAADGPRVMASHWVQRLPTETATFNLGQFNFYHAEYEGAPPLDVLMSEEAHAAVQRRNRGRDLSPDQSNKSQAVAVDISNSLKLFTAFFGRPPYDHFYVTEIPYGEGVSFPGMIDLSSETFKGITLDGFDEWFRAHEASHQWWGNGVHGGSYRDQWLSEGLASFSALWYLQIERKSSEQYFKFLDRYQAEIRDDQADAGSIWIGYRSAAPDLRRGADVMVYEKGAWVFNMLRVLMLDLRTMHDDRFTATMRDYYQTYMGGPATTADFQRVVEQHMGMPMDWFFDEWVRGTAIPTYHVAWKNEPADGGRFRIRLRVTQEHVPATFRMPVLIAADLGQNRIAHFRVDVQGAQGEYLSPPLPAEAQKVTFNDLHAVLAEVKTEGW
jgi:hypothetical protein